MMKQCVSARKAKISQSFKKSTALLFMLVLLQSQFCVPLCLLLKPEVIIKLH